MVAKSFCEAKMVYDEIIDRSQHAVMQERPDPI